MAAPAHAQQLPRPCDTNVCSTQVELVVAPYGQWLEDGFLDDVSEVATYHVTASAEFSPNTVCPSDNDILFQLATTEFARGNITPSRHTVEVPFNGGRVEVESQLEIYLVRGTPPMTTQGLVLRVIVQDCADGAQARAEANVTVAVTSELRPSLEVEFRQPDTQRSLFEFNALNDGNGNLLVEADVTVDPPLPAEAAPVLPEPVFVEVGEIRPLTVDVPQGPPGNYTITLTGRWAGDPANGSLPRVVYEQRAAVAAPPTPTPSGNSPAAASVWSLVAAALAAATLRRRT